MSPDELAEWEAYHYFEPFGPPTDDQRARIVNQLLWYGSGKFKGDPDDRMLFDRDPEETARLAAKAEASITLEDKVHALFGPMAVTVEEPPKPKYRHG